MFVPRYLRSMVPWREMTMVEVALLDRHSAGTSQQGSCISCRVG
jgi:hypothetical protein